MSSRLSADDSRPSPARRRRRLFAIGAGLFLPIVLIWLGAAFIVARGLQFPPALPYSTSGTAADAGLSAKSNVPLRELIRGPSTEITLEQNRAPLHALIAPAGQSPAVVLVYPNRVNSQNLVSYYNLIRAAGYRALIIDYDDPGARFGFGWKQRAGVAAAVAALRAQGTRQVALMGISEGAAAVLYAAAGGAPVAAVISDSSYAGLEYLLQRIPPMDSLNPLFDRTVLWGLGLTLGRPLSGLAPEKAAAQLDGRPLMVINGADDPLVPPSDARRIYAAARGPKQLWIVPHAGHAAALASAPAEYQRRAGAFLRRYLGAAAAP